MNVINRMLLFSGNRLPSGAIWRGPIVSIGLSISDYDNIDPTVRSIFFSDPLTLVDSATATTNALASPYLNLGYMIGSAAKGVALYPLGTSEETLIRAYKFFSVDYPVFRSDIFNGLDLNGFTAANPPVVSDQAGALRITAANNIAISGGLFVDATSTWLEKTPAPAKKTLKTLTGNKVVYTDVDPTTWRRACVNPTRTNKCTCRKINPTDLTNVNKAGNVVATLAVVDETLVSLQNAVDRFGNAVDLSKFCTSLKVYEINNTLGGSGIASVEIGGASGNTNAHSLRVFYRVVSGTQNTYSLKMEAVGASEVIYNSAVYKEVVSENRTPDNTSRRVVVGASIGAIVHFIMPCYEESAFITDPIVTAIDPATAIPRTGTAISKSTANLFPMTSATEAQNFGIYARFNLKAAGQVAKLLASYIDANNWTCLDATATTIAFTKRLAGTDIPVSSTITHAANVPIDVLAIQTDMGMSIKTRTYSGGAWSAWSAWVDDETASGKLVAKIAATLELGASNSTGHMYGNIPLESILHLGDRSTLSEYKAIAETEVLKINA